MYYVLFTYSKGQKERDFRGFRSDDDVIKFIHENYEKIDIVQIIAAEKSFRLALVETEELIKSELISQDIETDLPDPEKKSTMEKIIEETEETPEEMTEKEIIKKNKAALKKADDVIATAKKDLEKKPERLIINPAEKPTKESSRGYSKKELDKTGWPTCPECLKNRMAPWNKSGRCSECQQYKKIPKRTR